MPLECIFCPSAEGVLDLAPAAPGWALDLVALRPDVGDLVVNMDAAIVAEEQLDELEPTAESWTPRYSLVLDFAPDRLYKGDTFDEAESGS